MKTKFTATILTLLLSIGFVFGQDYAFKVLGNKGENSVKSGGVTTPLKTGSVIKDGESIKVGADSYLGLVHSSGRSLELKDPGEYAVADLVKKISTGATSVASKYADFVLSKMSGSQGQGNNMAVTGAVERATDDASIKVNLPSSVELYNPEAIITWAPVTGNHDYKIVLKNMFDEVVMETSSHEPSVKIDFSDPKLKDQRLIIFSVKLKDDESVQSGEYGIKKLSKEEAETIKTSLDALKAEIGDDSSLDKIIYASFYEENNLIIDAATNYEYAIKMSPDVEDFQNAYKQFLTRNGLGGK
jgi:hypothetical protein